MTEIPRVKGADTNVTEYNLDKKIKKRQRSGTASPPLTPQSKRLMEDLAAQHEKALTEAATVRPLQEDNVLIGSGLQPIITHKSSADNRVIRRGRRYTIDWDAPENKHTKIEGGILYVQREYMDQLGYMIKKWVPVEDKKPDQPPADEQGAAGGEGQVQVEVAQFQTEQVKPFTVMFAFLHRFLVVACQQRGRSS